MSTEGDEIQAKAGSLLVMKPLKGSSEWRVEGDEGRRGSLGEEEAEVWDRGENLAGGVHVKKAPMIWGVRAHPDRGRGPFELS